MSSQPQPAATEAAIEHSYFTTRMLALGITPEVNTIELWQGTSFDSEHHGENILTPCPIFRQSEKGIEILVYDLQRRKIKTRKDAQRSSHTVKVMDKDYTITRLEHPIIKTNGDHIKYLKPAKEPSYPFFPPQLVKKFDAKKKINCLYITEGFFKAFKADMHNIDCIGLQSITTLRDKETNTLWPDIIQLVKTCQVERLVWLTDGDFMNITSKDMAEGIDLYKRPNIFYNSAYTFYELTSGLDCEKYFAHINTETLTTYEHLSPKSVTVVGDGDTAYTRQPQAPRVLQPGPKGLDDLLCSGADIKEVAAELNDFSIMAPGREYPGKYITRICITLGTGYVRKYILKNDVTEFYLYHLTKRPDLKNITKFVFNGTTYKYNEEKGICEIEIPGDAAKYIRVGNDYYKIIQQPDAKKQLVEVIKGRNKATIVDDHGKDFCKHIKKYEDFCLIPDHFNYQPVHYNHYNLYSPFAWEPQEGDCTVTQAFFKHIFSETPVNYTDKDTGMTTQIPRYELGYDYFTIMYKYPAHILPILCLVSKERQTGKTTFHNYIDELFKGQGINIGNEDLEADFNAHWAGKLIIKVDETRVEKGKVIDKIKRLSTADSLILNAKGKDQSKLPFFAKFMLNSNHVEDFIKIDKEEIRFWIHEVPTIKTLNPDFMTDLIEEIPAFLHFLNTRKMATKREERHWFNSKLLETDALNRIKANSRPSMEKRICEEIGDLFDLDPTAEIFTIPLKALCEEILKKADRNWVIRTLHDMGIKCATDDSGKAKQARIKYPRIKEGTSQALGEIAGKEIGIEYVSYNGKYYEFHRKDFNDSPAIVLDAIKKDDLPF